MPQTPRSSSRSTKGVPPSRYCTLPKRAPTSATRSQDAMDVNDPEVNELNRASPNGGGSSRTDLDRTIVHVDDVESIATGCDVVAGPAPAHAPVEHLDAGHEPAAEASVLSAASNSSRASVGGSSAQQIDHMRHIIELNDRIISLQKQVELTQLARMASEEGRAKAELQFAQYQRLQDAREQLHQPDAPLTLYDPRTEIVEHESMQLAVQGAASTQNVVQGGAAIANLSCHSGPRNAVAVPNAVTSTMPSATPNSIADSYVPSAVVVPAKTSATYAAAVPVVAQTTHAEHVAISAAAPQATSAFSVMIGGVMYVPAASVHPLPCTNVGVHNAPVASTPAVIAAVVSNDGYAAIPATPAAFAPSTANATADETNAAYATSTMPRQSFSSVGDASSIPSTMSGAPSTVSQNDARHHERRRVHDLPPFSGLPEEWPMFIGSYRSTTYAFGYSELENLLRLQKSLSGDAKRTVQCLLIHPQHVEQAMVILETTFGRPDILVRSQIQQARHLSSISDENIEQIITFATSVRNLSTFLDTPATQHHLANPTLLDELVGKLPMSRRIDWAGVAVRIVPYPTINDFARWVSEVARLVSLVEPLGAASKQSSKGKHVLLNVMTSSATEQVSTCVFCGDEHKIERCEEFLRLKVPDRLREVFKFGLCLACLESGHILPGCERKRKCGVDGCDRWHNTKLHDKTPKRKYGGGGARTQNNGRLPSKQNDEPLSHQPSIAPVTTMEQSSTAVSAAMPPAIQPSMSSNAAANPAPTILNCREQAKTTLLFRVVPVLLYGRSRQIEVFALLDEGSSITLVDASLADELELDGPSADLNVQWFGAHSTVESSRKVSLGISGRQASSDRYEMSDVRTIEGLSLPVQTVDRVALRRSCPHLRRVPISNFKDARPRILIGLDHHYLGVPLDIRIDAKQRGIVAAKTALGWIVYGCDGPTPPPQPVVLHVSGVADDDRLEQLNELVHAHFTTEDFGVRLSEVPIESDEVIRAKRILADTTRRIGSRFETGLLWRADDVTLPNNYNMAMRRLCGVETKMKRDPEYAALYNAQIASYVEKGYARLLSNKESQARCGRTWYLPHFAVLNPQKPGKFRIVFDAAAKVGNVSLNTKLLSGPDMNVPLARLLLQFRLGAVGVCADIREMYHQVQVRAVDQDAQRFLWRAGDASVEPATYVMTAMTFGATCSPASAQHVKNVNATEHESEFPAAADAIRTKHYVDDFVASFDTPEDAARISAEVVEVHRRGGFDLRGFTSNSSLVLEQLGVVTGSGAPVCMQLEQTTTERVLGMCWNTSDDVFMFQTNFVRVKSDVMTGIRCPTKREMLSVSMSVFDPFGLLANFMLESKIMLQDLWRSGIGWDQPVPEMIEKRWHAWRSEIERTRQLRVQRCFSRHLRTSPDVQLHIFADASEAAFAAAAYWRVMHADGVDVSFVLGKTRCAPPKLLSVPRLELQAAVLASRLLTEIRQSLDVSIAAVVLWTDSETVLRWLQSNQRRYKQFVAFRVAEVLESAAVTCWRWVPTSMNVADDATRVKQPPKFDPESRWVRGPAWLKLPEQQWPTRTVSAGHADVADDESAEVRRKFVGVVVTTAEPMFEFTTFRRTCRIAAMTRRFISNARTGRAQRVSGAVDAKEIDDAMLFLCRMAQAESFGDEFAAMQRGQQIANSSPIWSLKPYLDERGLIRVYGRTDAAAEEILPHDARRPILLPRKNAFTRLLVQYYHERTAHQLVNATIAAVRGRFWVPQIRVLVRSVQSDCVVCKKRTARPVAPVQGQLPKDRLTPFERPFTSTGLDFFGPLQVTVGRRREKRWVALFTCLAVRAVHLEVAADLTADACLVCVRNLCHVRGTPTRIRCDNGTNFVGACNVLKKEDGFIDADVMQRELSTSGIQWIFNCPANPEAGGIWERLVQSVKRVLIVTLKEEAPRVETLRAHLLEAANMLNSRPLTHLPVAPAEDEALTPNHFLIGGPNAVTMAAPTNAEPAYVKKQWRICRELSRRFWAQWIREYLPELTRRSKNYPERNELAVDDLVIVCDENQPRGRWPMGRVTGVAVGSDGRVRTAEVKTAQGTHRRPVARLAVLDLESASNGARQTGSGMS